MGLNIGLWILLMLALDVALGASSDSKTELVSRQETPSTSSIIPSLVTYTDKEKSTAVGAIAYQSHKTQSKFLPNPLAPRGSYPAISTVSGTLFPPKNNSSLYQPSATGSVPPGLIGPALQTHPNSPKSYTNSTTVRSSIESFTISTGHNNTSALTTMTGISSDGRKTIQSSESKPPSSTGSTKSESHQTFESKSLNRSLTVSASATSQNLSPEPITVVETVTAPGGSTRLVTITATERPLSSSNSSDGATPTEVSQTTSSAASQSSAPLVHMPDPFIFDVLIDGQTYHLPSPGKEPTSIILHDGSQAKLSDDKVVIGGMAMQLSNNQMTSIGSHKIQKQPGETKEPEHEDDDDHHDGGGGGGGIGGLFGGLIGRAKKAGKGITGAGKSALNMAQGSLDLAKGTAGGVSFGNIAGTLSGAGKDVNSLVASINGIQKSMPTSMMTQAGLRTVLQAQNLGRETSNWLTSTASLIEGFKNLSEDVRKQVIKNIGEFAGKAGTLAKAEAALKAFEDFPWESEVPKSQAPSATKDPSASATEKPSKSKEATSSRGSQTKSETSQEKTTTEPTSSATKTSNGASSSTSSKEPSATPEEVPHVISTRDGTSDDEFKKLINELDQGSGKLWSFDTLKTHMYLTNITEAKAETLVKDHDFIKRVSRLEPIDEDYDGSKEEFRAVEKHDDIRLPVDTMNSVPSREEALTRKSLSPRILVTDENSPWWKRMISAQPPSANQPPANPSDDPPYMTDDSGGRGTTIYVLDDGFDLNLPDLAADGRRVDNVYAPNELTLGFVESDRRFLPGIGGGEHGTMMAIIAAGKTHGIAPNANLFLAKTKSKYRDRYFQDNKRTHTAGVQPRALEFIFNNVREHILDTLKRQESAKSVINMSWGRPLNAGGQSLDPIFEEFFQWCEEHNVPVVLSAGNLPGGANLHGGTPQHFGTESNHIITVGAVRKDGTLWPDTAVPVAGMDGSMTVFAPGEDIQVPTLNGVIPPEINARSGTSQAAAMTSGLIAYLYAWPGLNPFLLHHGFQNEMHSMKFILKRHSWARAEQVTWPKDWPHDHPINVIYNLARGDLDGHGNHCVVKRDDKNDTASPCTDAPERSSAKTTSAPSETTSEPRFTGTRIHNTTVVYEPHTAQSTSATATTSSTNPSSTAKPSEKPEKYYIVTKDGTTVDQFDDFIKELDKGAGTANTWDVDIIPHQSYLTKLKPSVAKGLKKKYDIISWIDDFALTPEDLKDTGEEFHAIQSPQHKLRSDRATSESDELDHINFAHSDLWRRSMLGPDSNAPHWKKMISSPFSKHPRPPSEDPGYYTDDSGGEGVTMYVIDDGFDLSQPDLHRANRKIDTLVIPKDVVTPTNLLDNVRLNNPNALILDQDINIGFHGTKMASIAGGRTHGVAPNADLFLVKAKGQWKKSSDHPKTSNMRYMPAAIHTALDSIRFTIQNRLKLDPNAKSVINLSWGIDVKWGNAVVEQSFTAFLDWCDRQRIPVVVAAGNDPTHAIDQTLPQKLGTSENTMITVGGVKQDGTLWENTSPQENGKPGSITVFAPAVDVAVPGDQSVPDDGTSQAAAIVSGLAAYFYALKDIGCIPDDNMKQFIVDHAWARTRAGLSATHSDTDWPPSEFKVVYNLAYGDTAHEGNPCAIHFRKRDGSAPDSCACKARPSSRSGSISATSTLPSSKSSTLKSSVLTTPTSRKGTETKQRTTASEKTNPTASQSDNQTASQSMKPSAPHPSRPPSSQTIQQTTSQSINPSGSSSTSHYGISSGSPSKSGSQISSSSQHTSQRSSPTTPKTHSQTKNQSSSIITSVSDSHATSPSSGLTTPQSGEPTTPHSRSQVTSQPSSSASSQQSTTKTNEITTTEKQERTITETKEKTTTEIKEGKKTETNGKTTLQVSLPTSTSSSQSSHANHSDHTASSPSPTDSGSNLFCVVGPGGPFPITSECEPSKWIPAPTTNHQTAPTPQPSSEPSHSMPPLSVLPPIVPGYDVPAPPSPSPDENNKHCDGLFVTDC